MSQAATPGPTRRSARLSSVARSVASQSVASVSFAAKDTPSKKKTPLPQLKSRQSTAYGASGRIGAAQELSIPQTGFSEAFETQRGAAVARNEEPLMSGGRNSSRACHTPTPDRDSSPSQPDYDSVEPPSDDDSEEEDSGANTSKSFGMGHEAGMLRQPTPRQPTPQRQAPLSSARLGAASVGAVTNGARRPLDSLVNRDRQGIENRETPLRPVGSVPGQSMSIRPPVRETAAGPITPRIPLIRPAQEPVSSNVAPRIPPVRPAQEPAAGNAASRTLLSRPLQPSNGRAVPPRPSPVRPVQKEPAVEPREELDEDRMWPWRSYLFGALALLLALALAWLIPQISPKAVGSYLANGWRNIGGLSADHSGVEARVDSLELTLKDIQRFVHSLGDDVPEYVVVSRSPGGAMTINKDFWDGVLSRIRNEGPSIEWDTFVENNQEKLNSALNQESKVLREELFKAMETSFGDISVDFDKKLASHSKSLLKEVSTVANKEAKKVAVEHARRHSLALTNMVANLELHLSKANYFSPGLGPSIITSITSPSLASRSAPLLRISQRILSLKRNPPEMALMKWDEPGDCWCAAPDEMRTGKAQLGIQLSQPIYPTQITLEHLPLTSAPKKDVSNAPKDVELWVESDEPALMRFGFDGDRCEPGPDGWQCLGKVRYDITGANHVQTFILDGESQTPVKKVMLRITSNWGADHTCIYRASLHGKDEASP